MSKETKKTPNRVKASPRGDAAEHRTSNNGKAEPKVIVSRGGFYDLLETIVNAQIDKERLEGKRDSKILAAAIEFAADIEKLGKQMEEGVAAAEKYATDHRNELFTSESKTSDVGAASFGFRMGKPALALLNEKWDWDKVVAAIKKKFAPLSSLLIVTKETPNKTAIKSQLGEKDLTKIGTRLDQEDKFFIEPKRDPADPRRLAVPRKAA